MTLISDCFCNLNSLIDLIIKTKKSKNWLASLRVLRTERISEIRYFQEVFKDSNVNELMLKVA